MRRTILSFAVSYLFMFHAPAQDSVSVSDFRYPETRAVDLKASMNGTYSGSHEDDIHLASPHGYFQSSAANGSANGKASFLYFHSMENHDIDLSVDLTGQYYEHDSRAEVQDSEMSSSSLSAKVNWETFVAPHLEYHHYLTPDGVSIETDVDASYRLSYESSTDNDYYSIHRVSRHYQVGFDGYVGVGYGRIRDGAVVFRALRIVQRLTDDHVLTRPPSRSEILKLVDRVAEQRRYTTDFERYVKYFAKDIISELSAMGLIADERIGAFESERIHEVFDESMYERLFGWRVTYLFRDSHVQSGSDLGYSHSVKDQWNHYHRLTVSAGVPLSVSTHLYASAFLELPLHSFLVDYFYSAYAKLSQEVAERIRAELSYRFIVDYGYSSIAFADETIYPNGGGGDVRGWSHSFSGNFVYFLEDNISLNLGVGIGLGGGKGPGLSAFPRPITPSFTRSSVSFSIGLSLNVI